MENTAATRDESGAQQLRLLTLPDPEPQELPASEVHSRFRLSKATRERGLRHVAEIREQLAAARAARDAESNVTPLPRRRPRRPAA